jgi:hypothetical protein
VNLLGDSADTIKKNKQTLIDASKEFGLEVNTEKTKPMLLSRHQNTGQSVQVMKILIMEFPLSSTDSKIFNKHKNSEKGKYKTT